MKMTTNSESELDVHHSTRPAVLYTVKPTSSEHLRSKVHLIQGVRLTCLFNTGLTVFSLQLPTCTLFV